MSDIRNYWLGTRGEWSLSMSDVPFKDYVDKIIADNEARHRVEYEHTIDMLHREHDKFETDIANRFKATNELRGALDDLGRKMETKAEADAAHKSLSDKIDEQGKLIAGLTSRLDQSPDVRLIQAQLAETTGQNKGSELTKAAVITYLLAAVSVLGVIILWANHK